MTVVDYLIRDASAPPLPAPADVAVAKVADVPADVDALYATARADKRCLTRRDRRYLQWRYVDNPARADYELWTARRGGELRGLMVLKPGSGLAPDAATIADWLVPEADVDATDALLAAAVRRQGEAGRQRLMTVLPPWSTEARRFAERGFAWTPSANWLQRRLIPFDAYQAVSEPLGEARLAALLPGDRTFIDWNFDVDWFRRVPDDPSRLQFGGLTGGRNEDLASIGRRLRARMLRIFPDLDELRVSHVWTGKCAGTFDFEPRIGCHDGIHYAGGYCFVGVPMGTLFGLKLARRLLGQPGADSAFDRPLRTFALYRGDPWFVPLAFRWMRRHDR
jgi:glycine/D-amino acid oxidase-like deaminating enzyme